MTPKIFSATIEEMENQTVPQTPVTLELPKKPGSKKFFYLFLVLAVVFSVSLILFAYSNLQKPVSQTNENKQPASQTQPSWTTYLNTDYGYSIDYPADWQMTETQDKSGASFKISTSQENPTVFVDAVYMINYDPEVAFAEYAKKAATYQIQNYNELKSYERVETENGTVGYMTTWMVSTPPGAAGEPSESNPITYFELPIQETPRMVSATLEDVSQLETYKKMLTTFKLL